MSLMEKIRRARPEDLSAISEIERDCFSVPWSDRLLSEEIGSPQAVFLVLCADMSVVAYINVRFIAGEGYIGNVAVKEEYRRSGYASQLLKALVHEARRLDARFLTLEVRTSNFPARRLYEKAGFSVAGERRNYYTCPTEDALIYTLYFDDTNGKEATVSL